MKAFRCKTCARLVGAQHAAERALPAACCVCGSGVSFARDGTKAYDDANWEVLADCTPGRLAELGIPPEIVERHTPWARGANAPAGHVALAAGDGAGTSDGAG